MDSSDSEPEFDSQFYFWNNWKPSRRINCEDIYSVSCVDEDPSPSFDNNGAALNIGNWIPPSSFGCKTLQFKSRDHELIEDSSVKDRGKIEDDKPLAIHQMRTWNVDWGPRMKESNSFNSFEDGDTTWIILHPGIFGILKLWINAYGHVVCKGGAEMNSAIGDEKIYIVLSSESHMRKLLAVQSDEWSALTEALLSAEETLCFAPGRNTDVHKAGPLQQLWLHLCHRRHWLPTISVKLRKNGIHKLTEFLRILPKFTVEDMRTFDGNEMV